MARRNCHCKAQNRLISRLFIAAGSPPSAISPPNARLACQNRGPGAPIEAAVFYLLLCMFNGFAIGQPLCRGIKVNLTGVGTRLVIALRPVQVPDGGRRMPKLGDDAPDGVD